MNLYQGDDPDRADYMVRLFGGPRLSGELAGRSLSPQQSAFLAIVYAHRRISRPHVSRILWRRDADRRSRASIRQLRHQVTRRAGIELVAAEGDDLVITVGIEDDLGAWREHLDEGRFLEAARLLREGFASRPLPGVHLEFLDWKDRVAMAFRSELESAARVAWASARETEKWDTAREAAEALYLLQDREERDYQQVIEARAKSGRLLAAEVAYADYVQHLDGKAADEGIESLMNRVRALARDQERSLAAAEVPFVGREDEMTRLQGAVERVKDGEFSVAIVSGESGIGKTRLMAEVRRLAQLDGVRCLTAQPVELEKPISLNPILDAISDVDLEPHLTRMGEPWRTVVGAMLPSSSPSATRVPPPPIDETALSRRLLDAFSLLLHSLAEEEPTILFIDDLQWVDATTMAVLEFYGRRHQDARFGVFATVRSELVAPEDPVLRLYDHGQSVAPTIVRLGDLATGSAEELVRLAGGESISPEIAFRLFELAGRHPLFLIELARELASEPPDRLKTIDSDFPVPLSVRAVVEGRTRGLRPLGLRVMRLLSAGTGRLALYVVLQRFGSHPEEAAAAVHQLEARRLVDNVDDRLGPVSPMIARAVYRDTPEPIRAALHAEWADLLSGQKGEVNEPALATHLDRAGSDEAARVATRVADRYRAQGAAAEAAHFYEVSSRNESEPTKKAKAFDDLGTALLSLRDLDHAIPALRQAATLFRSCGDSCRARRCELRMLSALAYSRKLKNPEILARLESGWLEAADAEDREAQGMALDVRLEIAFRTGDEVGADEALRRMAELLVGADDSTAAACHAGLAMKVLFGDPREGVRSARLAVELSETAPAHRGKALVRLMVALLVRGRLESPEGLKTVAEARAHATHTGDRRLRYIVESNFAIGLLDAGELDRAEIGFAVAEEFVEGVYPGMDTFNWAYNRGELELARGEFESAKDWFERAEIELRSDAPDFVGALVDAATGLAALEIGDLREARKREARLPDTPPTWCFDPTTLVTFRAKLLQRQGRTQEADRLIEEARARAEDRFVLTWLKLSILYIERLRRTDRTLEAQRLVRECLAVSRSCGLQVRTRQLEDFGLALSDTF